MALCKCGCGGEPKKAGVEYLRNHGASNPMFGKHQSDGLKEANRARMIGNKCAKGAKHPRLTALNKSRAGIPIADGPKDRQRQSILKWWGSPEGKKQRLVLSGINRKWAKENPERKFEAAKKGHRSCPRISSLEGRVSSLLVELGINFTPQYEYPLGFMDFLVHPDVAVFVNGEYWHNYPEGTEKDKKQLAYLKDHGYRPLVIWESELKDREKLECKLKSFNEEKYDSE